MAGDWSSRSASPVSGSVVARVVSVFLVRRAERDFLRVEVLLRDAALPVAALGASSVSATVAVRVFSSTSSSASGSATWTESAPPLASRIPFSVSSRRMERPSEAETPAAEKADRSSERDRCPCARPRVIRSVRAVSAAVSLFGASPTVVSATGSEAARAVLFIRAPPSLPWRLARGGGFPPTGRTNMSNVSEEQMFPVSIGYQQKWHRSPQNQWSNAPQRG